MIPCRIEQDIMFVRQGFFSGIKIRRALHNQNHCKGGILLCPITLAHYLLTKPEQDTLLSRRVRKPELPTRPDPRIIRLPAPVPMRTSLCQVNLFSYCSLFPIRPYLVLL